MAGIALESLWPHWLRTDEPLRFQMGVGFNCPIHKGEVLEFWFSNPADFDRPAPGRQLYWRIGAAFGELSIANCPDAKISWHVHPERLVAVCGWIGWVRDGRVFTLNDEDEEPTDPGIMPLTVG